MWSVRTTEASVIVDELDSAITAIRAFYNTLSSFMAPGMQVSVGPDIVERDSLEDQARPAQTAGAGSGTNAAAPALQLCLSWKTSLRARRGMGRTFFGPLNSTAVDAFGTPAATLISQAEQAANNLLAASNNATGWAIGVWGLQNPGQYDASGVLIPGQPHVHRDAIGFKIRDQFAILRSRRD